MTCLIKCDADTWLMSMYGYVCIIMAVLKVLTTQLHWFTV